MAKLSFKIYYFQRKFWLKSRLFRPGPGQVQNCQILARIPALLESRSSPALNPKFDCPSEKVLQTKLFPHVFAKVQDCVKSILSSRVGQSVTLTTDLWTSKTHHCFNCLTMLYLDDKFRLEMMVLGCFSFADDLDAASIRLRINIIVNDYNLGDKIHLVVRDNASNIVSALEHSDWDHVGCYQHILQLAVIHAIYEQPDMKTLLKKCRDLVGIYHHSSFPVSLH